MPHIQTNGVTLYYEEQGSGPALLLIAGLGSNRNAWATVVPELATRFRCITFDNRGTGRSEVPVGPYSIDDLADDTAGLIDALGVGPVLIVGWSMGGAVLQSLMVEHGDKVAKAVLLSTLPSYTFVQHVWLDGILGLYRTGIGAEVRGALGLPWVFTPHFLTDHQRVKAMLEFGLLDPEPTSLEGFSAQAQGMREFDLRPRLSEMRTPTMVLVGAEDVLTPPSQAVELASRIQGAHLVVLPRGGHAMVLEFTTSTVQAIENFLLSE